MKPITFKQANKSFGKSSSSTNNSCQSLHVYSDGKECISCWKMSFFQRLIVCFTGKIYLGVVAGSSHPPVYLNAINPLRLTALQKCKVWWKSAIGVLTDFFQSSHNFLIDFLSHFGEYIQQKEKRMYMIAGALIAGVSSFVLTPIIGMFTVFVASITKEYIDAHLDGHYWNWLDIVFTILGGILGTLITLVLQNSIICLPIY